MFNRRHLGVSLAVLAVGTSSLWFFMSPARHHRDGNIRAVTATCQASLVNLHSPYIFTLREASATPTFALLGPKPTSPKQPTVRVTLVVSCSGAPPQWWGRQGVGLTSIHAADEKGRMTTLFENYFGFTEPVRPGLANCNIEYTLPARIAGRKVSDIACVMDTSDPYSGRYRSIPLAAVKVHLLPQVKSEDRGQGARG